jgi:hypothetical protein
MNRLMPRCGGIGRLGFLDEAHENFQKSTVEPYSTPEI